MRGTIWMDGVRRDLIVGWRGLVRTPGLPLVALLSLGLGVGVNLTIFSLIDAALLRDVTADRPDRLVRLRVGAANQVSIPNYRDLRDAASSGRVASGSASSGGGATSRNASSAGGAAGPLVDIAGFLDTHVQWTQGDRTERLFAQVGSANLFDLLGPRAQAASGRLFTAAGASPGAAPDATPGVKASPNAGAGAGTGRGASADVGSETDTDTVVLSHGFWQRRLAADPAIVGRTLTLNGRALTVIGILPRDYVPLSEPGATPQIYVPASATFLPQFDRRDQIALSLVGRLRDDASPEQARQALHAAASRLEATYPDANKGLASTTRGSAISGLARLTQDDGGNSLLFIVMLGIVISLVFLVACANVAGLLLARGLTRGREIAIRLALGASRARVVRQLLLESLLIAAIGTAAGLAFSLAAARLLSQVPLPTPVPYDLAVTADARLIAYACALAAAATLLCGLAPAWRHSGGQLIAAIHERQARTEGRHRRFTPRHLLVVAQMAVSIVLLVTALLFLRSLAAAAFVDPGFDTARTLSVSLQLPPARLEGASLRAFEAEAIDSLRATPGVQTASCAAFAPVSFSGAGTELRVPGDSRPPRGVAMNSICPDYFRTMGIALLRGREFTAIDRDSAPAVAIVNETLARQIAGTADAIGQRLDQQMQIGAETIRLTVEIVGVVRDSKYGSLGETPQAMLYRPFLQPPVIRRQAVLLARAAASADAVRRDVEQTLARLDPSATITVTPLRDTVSASMTPSRVASALLAALGGLGLLLASIGLYGAMAFAVGRRTREIGIRMALGATRRAIIRMVLADSILLVAAGAAIGLCLSLLVTAPLRPFFAAGVSATDPATFLLVIAVLLAAGLLAGLPPARRAAGVDPNHALRAE